MVQLTKIEADETELDLSFYRDHYTEMKDASDQEIFQHWYKTGKSEGWFPNPDYALDIFLNQPGIPEDFDVAGYLKYNPDIAEKYQWPFQAVEHYLRKGATEQRHYKEPPAAETPPPSADMDAANRSTNTATDEASLRDKFNPDFYRTLYPDLANDTDEKCLEHWLRFGRKENRYGYLEEFLAQHKNIDEIPKGFNLASYIAKNSNLSANFDQDIEYLVHFLDTGINEGRLCTVTDYCPRFIEQYYGIELQEGLDPHDVLEIIKDKTNATLATIIYLTTDELIINHGIYSKDFVTIFDHEAYRYSNLETQDLPADNYAQCLQHFLTHGINSGFDISYRHQFDPDFYVDEYKSDLTSTFSSEFLKFYIDKRKDQESSVELEKIRTVLFKHWVKEGIGEKYYPNLIVFAKNEFNLEIPKRLSQDLKLYYSQNPDLEKLEKPSDLLNHLVKHGASENRPGINFSNETASFFSGIAEMSMAAGKRNEAVKIYNKILQNTPDFPIAKHNLADDLLRHGFDADAARHYQSLIQNQTATQWSYINLSACLERLGENYESALAIKNGAMAFPEDVSMQSRSDAATLHQFTLILRNARSRASVDGIAYAREQVRNGLKLFEKEHFASLRTKSIQHVSIIGNHDLPQCQAYRIDQKIDQLKAAGFDVRVFKHNESLSGYHERLDETDAVIFYRVAALPEMIEAIMSANIRGIPTFYEIDDLLFDEELFPPPLETYAGQITHAQHASMATDVPLLNYAMSLCRFGIASTQTLLEQMEPIVHSGKVFLHRNAFGTLHQQMANLPALDSNPDDSPITIFYGSGTKAHKDDFHNIVEPVFTRLHDKYGDKVRFLVLGHITLTPDLKELGDQLTLMDPIWDTEDYWLVMRENAQINLSVLSRNLVTDAKSEIKWMEAAMFGIPSVVSRTKTHEDAIDDGVTGYLCDDSDEFYTVIEKLIEEPETRQRIGDAARAKVLQDYSIKAQAENLENIFESLIPESDEPRKKKIAVVNVFYPPQAIGGATRVVHDNVTDFINEFGDQAEVCIFTTTNGETPYLLKKYIHDGIPVTAVTTDNSPELESRVTDNRMGAAFAEFLNEYKPDLIHFHCIQRLTSSVVSEARKAEIPYIITAHDGWWISDKQFLVDENDEISTYQYDDDKDDQIGINKNRQRVLKKELLGAKYIAAVSEPFAKIYSDTGLPNVITIENGVSKLSTKPRTKSQTGKIRLAQIGGAARHKGYHLVQHALMANPQFENLELTIVDHAALKGSIKYDVWGSTPVTFIPKVAQKDVAELFSSIDVLLAPSIWPESYGLVTREALMCGCRVIASDLGAIGACIENGVNGLRIDVSNADALGDALAEVNAHTEFYATPPKDLPKLRPAVQQARDLAKLYKKILTTKKSS